jgi:folate-binding protein YgfZ
MLTETPLKTLHQTTGASFGEWFGCRLPASFAGFAEEYRAAREGVALVDTNYRAWFRLAGPDRVRYLNAMLTNETKGLAPGQGTRALLLNPQGHILSELEVLSLEEEYLLSCPMPMRQRTFETLDKYIIMDDATLTEVTEGTASVGFEGPEALHALTALLGVDLDQWSNFEHRTILFHGTDVRLVRNSETGLPGVRIVAPRKDIGAVWTALASTAREARGMPVGWEALNTLRLEAGIPWLGYDFGEKTIPHEAALETTHISFSKGCYVGQEIVERVRSRGHVNRRRTGLAFSGTRVPPAGTILTHSGKEAGHVTSAAFSPRLNRPIGMGYLRREFLAAGMCFDWPGGTANVIELPLVSEEVCGQGATEVKSQGGI